MCEKHAFHAQSSSGRLTARSVNRFKLRSRPIDNEAAKETKRGVQDERQLCGPGCQIAVRYNLSDRVPSRSHSVRETSSHRVTDTPEQVSNLPPKEKAPNKGAQVDDAGEAIVAQIRTAADLVKDDCESRYECRTQAFTELRAAEDRTHQIVAEVEHWRDRATRAERWLWVIRKRLKTSCSLGEHSLVRKRPQSVN
jgi:hypothetical protein